MNISEKWIYTYVYVECVVWIQTFSWRSIWRYATTITSPVFENSRQSNGKQKNVSFSFSLAPVRSNWRAKKIIIIVYIVTSAPHMHAYCIHMYVRCHGKKQKQRKKKIRQIGMGERVSERSQNNSTNESWKKPTDFSLFFLRIGKNIRYSLEKAGDAQWKTTKEPIHA